MTAYGRLCWVHICLLQVQVDASFCDWQRRQKFCLNKLSLISVTLKKTMMLIWQFLLKWWWRQWKLTHKPRIHSQFSVDLTPATHCCAWCAESLRRSQHLVQSTVSSHELREVHLWLCGLWNSAGLAITMSRVQISPLAAVCQRQVSVLSLRGRLMSTAKAGE